MSTNMKSREEFLSVIQTNLHDELRINYYTTGNTGFSISTTEFRNTTEKVHELLAKMTDDGFQFIGILVSDYLWLPCLLLSIWKSGKACACVGTQYADEYNSNFLDSLNVRYLITDTDEFWSSASETVSAFQINSQKFYIKKRKFYIHVKNSDADICYGIMTSGTTGVPKIVKVPWTCILPNVYELISLFSVDRNDNICLLSPYTFDPFFIELFIWMITGCHLTVISLILKICPETLLDIFFKKQSYNFKEENVKGFDANIVCKTNKITNSLVTILQITPSVFKRWSTSCIKNNILSSGSSLRVLLMGGEKFPGNILKLKSNINQTKIYNIYGITEISCWAFISDALESCEEISIGKPLNGILYKIDDKYELHIGSQSRKCLVDNETNFNSDEVVFRRTGDIVSVKNGEIYFRSRTNQLVKKFGIKINLEKIETSFVAVNKHISECVCIFDENAMKTAIFYVNNNIKHDYLIITGKDRKMLTNFKESTTSNIEIPDYVIEIQQFPVNSNGKCDKKRLLQILRDAIDSKNIEADAEEESFKNIWTSYVESDNFIASGGDSVKALQILTQLQEKGIRVTENFLPTLMNDGGYENCLSCLISGGNSSKRIRKKIKLDDTGEKFKFSISWRFNTKKCVDASPAVGEYNGVASVIVGSHSYRLSSVKVDNGEENWTIDLGGRIESGVCLDKSSNFGVVGCYNTYVYCISVADGEIIWKYKTEGMIKSTPCLSTNGKYVYVASYDTFLYCLEFSSGTLIKKVKLGGRGILSSGITSDELGTFFIATLDGTCVSLNQETNTVTWKNSLENPVFASPLLIKNESVIAVVFAEVIGCLHCFDAKTGTKIWDYRTGACIYSTPVLTSEFIIFGCYNSQLYCLKFSREPVLLWKEEFDSPIFAKPCFYDRADETFVIVASTKGWIYLCAVDSGRKVARIKLNGEVFSSPKIFRDGLVLGCRDNNLYRLKISSNVS